LGEDAHEADGSSRPTAAGAADAPGYGPPRGAQSPVDGAGSSVRATFQYAGFVVNLDRNSVVVHSDDGGPDVVRRRGALR